MNKLRLTIKLLVIATFMFAFASIAQAQATRTWVSGVGDDVNPCSRTAPCKTFAGAISKTADGGEIDCIDPGGFGTVTITKSITLDGGGTFGSILASGTNGINVNDSSSGSPMTKVVRIRNLSINGAGTGLVGVNYTSAKAVLIENCAIFGFKAGSGHGVNANLTADGGTLYVRDTNISDCLNDGIRTTTTTGAVKFIGENVKVTRTTVGYEAVDKSSFHLVNCSSSGNTQGAQIENASSANFDHCTFQQNSNGVFSGPGASTVRLSDCTIVNNASAGVQISGGTVFTYGDNKIRGNGPAGVTDVNGGVLNGSTTKQ